MGEIAVGDLIYNRYRVLRFFKGTDQGSGGLIILCWDETEKKEYILKTPKSKDIPSNEKINEFCYIAKNWINLGSSPYIVKAFELFYWQKRPFLKLEYVKSSETEINELKDLFLTPYTNLKVLQLMIQFCLGMQNAFSKGLIAHNDIKPSNVLYDGKNIKINDFGCAEFEFREINWINNELHGTPEWMAPERFNGQYSESTDIYSAGLIFYYLVSQGRHPYHAEDGKWAEAHKNTKLERLDNELSPVIYKCLEKDPQNRYKSFEEFLNDLISTLDSLTTHELTRPLTNIKSKLSNYDLTPTMTTNYDNRPSLTSENVNTPTIITNIYDNRPSTITVYDNRPSITSTVSESFPPSSRSTSTYENQPTINSSYEDNPTDSFCPSDIKLDIYEPQFDENVQFTVLRPNKIAPEKWYDLLIFAHLSEKRSDAPVDEPDPIKEVQRQVKQILQDKTEDYAEIVQDSSQAVPREGQITLVPKVKGITFNPPQKTFYWHESVHREDFRLKTSSKYDNNTLRGELTVFLGNIILCTINLAIKVDSSASSKETSLESDSRSKYRKIFASYSHDDLAIVNEFEHYVSCVGDKYLIDQNHLRTGEIWSERLMQMIKEADIFQLFWSWNSIHSQFVQKEYEYALSLNRNNFIRPVYWEKPFPHLPEKDLPPEELCQIQFGKIMPIQTFNENSVTRGPQKGNETHQRNRHDFNNDQQFEGGKRKTIMESHHNKFNKYEEGGSSPSESPNYTRCLIGIGIIILVLFLLMWFIF